MKFDHPATFDTMAMESELKRAMMDDLERFVRRKEFYKKLGKVWKGGLLAIWASCDWEIEVDCSHG